MACQEKLLNIHNFLNKYIDYFEKIMYYNGKEIFWRNYMIWHSSDKNQVLKYFNVDKENGLSDSKAQLILDDINSAGYENKASVFLKTFSKQFNSITTIILLVAVALSAVVSLIANAGLDLANLMIIAVMAIFGVMSVIKVHFLEKIDGSADIYKKYISTVLRDGEKITLKSDEIVPGDIILLNTGDYIPADARLIDTVNLRCDEYVLTGEIVYVDKDADLIAEDISEIKDRKNMVFAGCSVMSGQAVAIVTEIRDETELSKQKINKSYLYEDKTSQISLVCKYSGIIIAVVCAVIFILSLIFSGNSTEQNFAITVINAVITCTAIAIACYPESLPSIVTAIKSIGIKKLQAAGIILLNQSVIKKASKISVICADKGEVFTTDKMSVAKLFNGRKIADINEGIDEEDLMLIKLSSLCNDEENLDPTDYALFDICESSAGIPRNDLKNLYPTLSLIPFDNERKLITAVKMINGKPFAIVKGAPEILVSKCLGIDATGALKVNDILASEALKVIAVGYKELNEVPAIPSTVELENELTFAGFIGFETKLSYNAVETVRALESANIRSVLITGDNLITAKAIAEKVGILKGNLKCITDEELSALTDEELDKEVTSYAVFARVSPENRFRIVKALQHNNEKVAITGNNVFDAPALRKATLGIALKSTASDVAKNASDLIIEDTSLNSILTAIATCKNIYASIKRTLHYILSSNLGELLTMLIGLIIFRIPVLLAVQLLFVNVITDIFPALSIGMAPIDTVKITKDKSRIFTLKSSVKLAIEAIFITVLCLVGFFIGNKFSHDVARTLVFAVIGFTQILHISSCYSESYIWKSEIIKNKYIILTTIISAAVMLLALATPIGVLFGLTTLPATYVWTVILLSLIFIVGDELIKLGFLLYQKYSK